MLHLPLSGKHKYLAQLLCCVAAGHLIALFLIFFVYRGDLYERHLTINLPLDAHIVLMPFQKSLLGSGGGKPGRPKKQKTTETKQDDSFLDDGPDNDDSGVDSLPSKIQPSSTLSGQITTLDNGDFERKRKAREREKKRRKKLAREKREKALREKKKKDLAKKKAAEEKMRLEQKSAEDKKRAEKKKSDAALAQEAEKRQKEEQKKVEEQKKQAELKKTPAVDIDLLNDVSGADQVEGGDGGFGDGDQPFYVGQYDLETIQLAQQVAAEVATVWRPPAGFRNRSCTVRCILDWQGGITSLAFEQPSGSPVFDVSVKQAMHKMKFPKELYGKEIILPFTA